jgi:ABC-type branched-subunit amino acid transport system substrate-binding protein
MSKNRRWLKIASGLAVGALLAAACSSSKKSASTTGTTSGATATTAGGGSTGYRAAKVSEIEALVKNDPLTGTPGSGLTRGISATEVKVGCIIQAAFYAGAADGFRARFERVNREGGINGRKINFLGCEDDNSDPTRHFQIARRLVEQDQVFAVLTLSASLLPETADYLNQHEVPYFGWGFTSQFCGHRWGFGFNGCLNGSSAGSLVPHPIVPGSHALAIIQASGLQPSQVRAAFEADDGDDGRAGNVSYNASFMAAGAKVVYSQAQVPVPGPTTDYTPFVQPVLAANPNIVFTSTAFGDVGGFSAALKAAGYKGINMNFVAYIPGLLDSSPQLAQALDGTYVNSEIVPQEEQTPYIKQIESDLTAIHPKTGTSILFGTALGYVQAEQLSEMLQASGKDLNTKTFDQAINQGSFRFAPPQQGGPGELGWPAGHFTLADCVAIVKVNNKKFDVVNPFKCYDSIILPKK